MTVGGFNDVVERFVDADRNRIGDFTGGDLTTLNGRVQQIRKLWERRYSDAFALDEGVVFGDSFTGFRVAGGVIDDPYRFARNWPLDPTPRQPGGIQRDVELRAYGIVDDSWDDAQGNDGRGHDYESEDLGGIDEGVYDDDLGYADGYGYDGYYGFGYYGMGYGPGLYDDLDDAGGNRIADAEQRNIEEGREVAVARFPARGNLPALSVSMIDEAYGWKIDIPETVTGATLRRLLLNHLTFLGENPQVWPRDRDQAARLFAHHVIMAAYGLGVPAYQAGGSTATADSGGGDASADARTVTVTATDFEFQPRRILVRPGEKLQVKLVNRGSNPHNIEFELPSGEVELEKPVPPGQSKTLTFTAPQEPGVYVLYCPVAQHRARGMEGRLVVEQRRPR